MPTTDAFANVVFIAGGVVAVAPNPFGLQGKNLVYSFMERQGVLVVPTVEASSYMASLFGP
jgi:hypothetical protein